MNGRLVCAASGHPLSVVRCKVCGELECWRLGIAKGFYAFCAKCAEPRDYDILTPSYTDKLLASFQGPGTIKIPGGAKLP